MLTWLLLISVGVALLEAAIRLPPVLKGGPQAGDHRVTLAVSLVACGLLCGLLVLVRIGYQAYGVWGLLSLYAAVAAWLFIVEGTGDPFAIVLCPLLVVTASTLFGFRASLLVATLVTATLVIVAAARPHGDNLGVLGQLGVGGGLAALAVLLYPRTVDGRDPAREPMPTDASLAQLTARELQIARLIAAGRSNAEIARELFVSLRTVHTHVSNVLRKTGCTNRTELAVLVVRTEGHLPPRSGDGNNPP